MSHPFFDAVTFPWHHPLAKEFHKALSQAIKEPKRIELLCQACSQDMLLNLGTAPDILWKEALERLTTARELGKLCENLLKDASVTSIHKTVSDIVNVQAREANAALSKLVGFDVVEVSRKAPDDNSEYRFEVALSFAGDNKRDKVRQIAELLRNALGDGKVFFDEWFEAEIAGLDAVDYLQNVYGKQSQLVVTCVCARYNEKPWTQDEWRAIRAFERGLRDVNTGNLKRMRFLPLRFGDGEVDGLFSTAIVPDVRDRTPAAIAKLILERWRLSKGGSPSGGQSAVAATDADLLIDAARPYEASESREWYDESRKRLQDLAQEILEESEVTRKFVLKCNGLASSMTAESLGQRLLCADEPMMYLRRCHNQTKLKNKLPEESRRELHACLYRLIHFIAPVCFSAEDLQTMDAHVNRKQGNYAHVSNNSKCLAVTKVAGLKGVRADLNTYPDWENLA